MAPVVTAFCALPLLADSVFAFTNLDSRARAVGAAGVLVRVAILLAGVLALRAYDLVVRGPDRGVVDLHPVRAAAYVRARLFRAAAAAWPTLATGLVVLVPIRGDAPVVVAGLLLLGGGWAAGLGVGLGVNLAAPALAVDPRMAGLLDAIRGQNPRAQAALIWAPAVSLAAVGLAVVAAGAGLQSALLGDARGYLALLVPWATAAAGVRLAFVDGNTLARIPAVLGEVDAAYAAVEEAEEGRRVYLEWLVPRVPASLRPELLRVLRGGWRAERAWLSGSFVGALLVLAAGWTHDPELRGRVVIVGGAVLAFVGMLGPRLRARDPAWLVLNLPGRGRRAAVAVALLAWGQVVILGGVAALLVRQGLPGLGAGVRLEAMLLAFAAVGAWLPMSGYVPLALAVWALGGWA